MAPTTQVPSPAATEPASSGKIGYWGAVAVILGNVLGSSIFISLHYQANALPDAWSILAVWIFGAFIAWCGAVSYAELASMFPDNGGEANYLSKIYHPAAGFLSGWISIIAGFPAPLALIALIFGSYAAPLFWPDAVGDARLAVARGFAAGLIVLVCLTHCFSLRLADRFHQSSTYLKAGLLAILAVLIVWFAPTPQKEAYALTTSTWQGIFSGSFAIQTYFVLYAYAGWNAACYIATEVKDAPRTVPRALLMGLFLATTLYLAMNHAMLWAVPKATLAETPDILQKAAEICFGSRGATITTAIICLGMFSSASGLLWVGSRVAQKVAAGNLALKPLQGQNKQGVPVRAVIFQSIVALAVLWLFQDPQGVLLYVEFLLQISAFLTVLGVFILRVRDPNRPRPFRATGYPIIPAIFLIWVVIATNQLLKREASVIKGGLLTLVVGAAVYVAGLPPRKKA